MVHHVVAGKAGNRKYDKILICFGRGSRTHANSTMSGKFGVKEWTNPIHAHQNWSHQNSRNRITRNLTWVITSATSARKPKFKLIFHVG